jgi:hypothetical protein
MMLFHPSSLGRIMTNAKSGKPADLSVGAMTYCRQLAKEFVYGYRAEPSSKYMEKGTICEQQSIELYNEVFFTNLTKNPQRRKNEWLTGECDIDTGTKIIDIKTAWSLDTFPAVNADVHDTDYEWQGRAYMMLWDRPVFELAYCMVSTPLELIGWEDESAHIVDHIDPALRVTAIQYDRDSEKEELIKIKVDAARAYINKIFDQIAEDHSGVVIQRGVAA